MACSLKQSDIKKVKALGFLHNKGTDEFNGRIITVNGKITAKQNLKISEAAMKYGNGTVTFTNRLNIEVPGIHYDNIEPFIQAVQEIGLDTGGTGAKVRPVVSCKGTTCQFGLYDTFALSEEVYKRFYLGYRSVTLPHKFKIAVGGCPNNCMKPDLNDVGIVGQLIPDYNVDLCRNCRVCMIEANCPMKAAKVVDGKISLNKDICYNCGRCVNKCPFKCVNPKQYGFKVYIGGRWGKQVARGMVIDHFFTNEEEVLSFVEKVILFYREKGIKGERLSQTIERIGFEKVEAELLSDEILTRKEEILKD